MKSHRTEHHGALALRTLLPDVESRYGQGSVHHYLCSFSKAAARQVQVTKSSAGGVFFFPYPTNITIKIQDSQAFSAYLPTTHFTLSRQYFAPKLKILITTTWLTAYSSIELI